MKLPIKSHRNDDLIALLRDGQTELRMLSLHLLCEAYATSASIIDHVFHGWDTWGAEGAFPEFPMISHLPVPAEKITECCERATDMARDRKLTHPDSRCAGKLIEQLVLLPPDALSPHRALIEATAAQSKIFFRVDLNTVRDRVELLGSNADQLAGALDKMIAKLAEAPEDRTALSRGLIILESLRREHPGYLDLGNVLKAGPKPAGQTSASFQLTLKSLIQFEEAGLDERLAEHLTAEDEATVSSVVEALVRSGTEEAAETLLDSLFEATPDNRKWIARGLQRIRVERISPRISQLRDSTTDPRLWLMLLIAEVRQFEAESCERLTRDLKRLQSTSETLIDALTIYRRINEVELLGSAFQDASTEYVQRSNAALTGRIEKK